MPLLLAQPGRIGPLKLKNRIIMGPMGTNFGSADGLATARDQSYYTERARGGVAMVITESMPVSEKSVNHTRSLGAFHDRFIPGLAALVEAVHVAGALAAGQLNHRGGLLRRSVLNMEPVGPSPWVNPNTGDSVRPLTIPEIREIQRDFLTAASRLWRAGYDAVEIHAANGYLFHQFFSPRINRRVDVYGGTLENRMRFLLETVALMRESLPDLPLLVRISATEYVQHGYGESDVIALARALEREGISALDLSGGTNESPELSRFCIQPPSMPRRCLEPYAASIKQVISIPVVVAGRIIEPPDAEAVLANGSADFVALGRALIADPYWTRKATGEIEMPIRQCISCNFCFERLTRELDISCAQNPMVGLEFEALEFAEPQALPALAGRKPLGVKRHKRVLILGAGVAGLESARLLAARGHTVEVWEKADQPGGQSILARIPPHKQEVAAVWAYRFKQCRDLGVSIRTKVTVTLHAVREFAPDLVVVATGARPRIPAVFRDAPHLTAWAVLARPDQIANGSSITIVGGGMVGAETAELLATQGCRITILEMLDALAMDMPRNNRLDVTLRLQEKGVTALTRTRVDRVAGNRLIVLTDDGEKAIPIGDYLVVAIGAEPNRDVIPTLEEAGLPYVLVGDCDRPGNFHSALRDAWLTALSVDFEVVGGGPTHASRG